MAYKIGDKFVIEIDSVMTNKNGTSYGIKGFKSLVFDEYGLEQLERIPGKYEYHVGDEVVDTARGINGVVTHSVPNCISILYRDGHVDRIYRASTNAPFQRIKQTGFVDHRIIEWVSES